MEFRDAEQVLTPYNKPYRKNGLVMDGHKMWIILYPLLGLCPAAVASPDVQRDTVIVEIILYGFFSWELKLIS
jgi:hypothetical protein